MSHVPLFIHDGKRHQSELRLDVKNSEEGRIKRSLWGQQGEHSKAGGVCFPAWCDEGEVKMHVHPRGSVCWILQ